MDERKYTLTMCYDMYYSISFISNILDLFYKVSNHRDWVSTIGDQLVGLIPIPLNDYKTPLQDKYLVN